MRISLPLVSLALLAAACGDGGDTDGHNEGEVITTIALTFSPAAGGAASVFEFDDPDGDGGEAPSVDAIELSPGRYIVAVSFENRLEDPPEDITVEIDDESGEHQIFFTGSAVEGPASAEPDAFLVHTYADMDPSGLAIGLENGITAEAGSGELIVTLRHLPPIGGEAVKTAELAAAVAAGGFSAIGGATDAQVTFPVTVE